MGRFTNVLIVPFPSLWTYIPLHNQVTSRGKIIMKTLALATAAITAVLITAPLHAEIFSNAQDSQDFPQGVSSFADMIVEFNSGSVVEDAFLDPTNALGPPDVTFASGAACFGTPSTTNCLFTSLGNGGSLTVKFTDNFLTGSSTNGMADGIADLFVFEVVVPESTFISVSADGSDGSFIDVGNLAGAGGGVSIDIDAFGFDIDSRLQYVKILDDTAEVESSSPAGADIDAIGAISSMAIPIPSTLR